MVILVLLMLGAPAYGGVTNQTRPAPASSLRAAVKQAKELADEALARFRAGRPEDAERLARRALDLRAMELKARYVLGAALASQKKNLSEAIENLSASAEEFPEAHLELCRLLIEQGQMDRAVEELERFTKRIPPPARLP